ncbi:MAG: hypothetical protein AAGF11_25880 [Myxococcota bacterium]
MALVACGPDLAPPDALLDDRCGEPEPALLLALDADDRVPIREDAFVVYGDRRLIAVDTHDGMSVSSSRVVSVDECGEGEPTLIAEGINRIAKPTEEGLLWLGCSEQTQQMFMIDPNGQGEPSPLGFVRLCDYEESPGRLWVQRNFGGPDQIVMMELSSLPGSVAETVLISTMDDHVLPGNSSFAVADDYLWLINEQHQLIQRDLEPEIEITTLSDDAAQVWLTRNGRFLAWGSEEFGIPGRWTVYDRESEEQFEVSVGEQPDVELRLIRHSLIFEVEVDSVTSWFTRIHLPSMETTTFKGNWGKITDTEAGDLVLESKAADGGLYVLTVGSAEPELLYDGRAGDDGSHVVSFRTEGQDVLVWDEYDSGQGLGLDREINTQLVRIPLDSRVPEVIIDEVYQPLELDDGRWLQVRGWDREGVGELRVLDPSEGTEQVVDRNVNLHFARWHGTDRFTSQIDTLPADDSFVYSVHGGERHGLWTAALAPVR